MAVAVSSRELSIRFISEVVFAENEQGNSMTIETEDGVREERQSSRGVHSL